MSTSPNSSTTEAYALAEASIEAAVREMGKNAPGTSGEIDFVDFSTDWAWEALRGELGLPLAHPMSSILYEFIQDIATMNLTAEGRRVRVTLVAGGALHEAMTQMRAATALTPEYAAVLIEEAASPFSALAREHRFA